MSYFAQAGVILIEVLFGLFMVLTFTGTLSVATAGREDVRVMLVAAIGCNIHDQIKRLIERCRPSVKIFLLGRLKPFVGCNFAATPPE